MDELKTDDFAHDSTQDIGGALVRGGAATMLANGAAQGIRFVATLLLARLLLPAEFGLFAMIYSAIGIAGVMRDMGLSMATIQSPTLTGRQVSTLFWINSGFGLLATLGIIAASPWIARGLGVPGSVLLIAGLAPVFLLTGLATQHRALMNRRMAFMSLARMTLWSALVAQCLALVLAWCGAGVWALIAGALATELVATIWCWCAESWRPSRMFSFAETRRLLIFGGYLAVFNLLGYLAGNVHQLLIGIVRGPVEAGYFNRAYVLILAPVSMLLVPVGGVITAALSRLQADPPEFARHYLGSISTLNLLSAPLGFFSLLFAAEIVRVLLGPGWAESGVLLQLMAISLMVQPLMFSTGWVYMATGQARRAFWWGNVGWSVILLMYLPGLIWGARGVAAAHSLALLLLFLPCLHFAFHGTIITTRDTLRICAPAGLAAGLALLPAWGVRELLMSASPLAILTSGLLTYSLSYVVLLIVVGEKLRIMNLVRHMRAWVFK
ncbi:MAG: lipopolysaccharide biosynthesis protein [Stenotrophobium sp.]